ncbi:DUF2252 domain-containing protein [Nocardioides sp. MAH-18]|uniref:DUF2252 domain-containing protein n=1 Tax=Nocardioides agri TaxID=2682843 RepID=A0A6L6XWR2_9ACTN|nr:MULTISPECIES: DUF2252 domain-containing protein [unclassified Nocardioides]MBA2952487.1 DUF2252 domain-containing protein [Nocardioides sp. CGMCC 1.13656]MVQ51649.1 DUF2252 domain-containing protein [Nocardioides sp. MAH-18]
MGSREGARSRYIVDVLVEAFDDLLRADPHGFRTKFRKMAADPFAFYRGSACLFSADVAGVDDRWADDRTSRVWIHGDLHVENFGTYMNGEGLLVFDVNDFDEAYLGHFSWDLRRFCASLALMCWQKALPEDDVRALAEVYLRSYLDQVRRYRETDDDLGDFSLRLDNTEGPVHAVLLAARAQTRIAMLESMTVVTDHERRFVDDAKARHLNAAERSMVLAAFARYVETIPASKRFSQPVFYDVKDVVATTGFGIGSAGLPAYNVLIEGFNQALENDIVLSMKQGNRPALSRVVDDERLGSFFEHDGHRTVVSQRALQAHADPLLGWTTIDGTGFVVSELSPYELDLDWSDVTEPDEMAPLLGDLGRATAKVHCASDEDSDQRLVDFQTEEAILGAVGDREDEFVEDVVDFAETYAATAQRDHALFVEAFRAGRIAGLSATR